MRQLAIDVCKEQFQRFGIDSNVKAIDIGGAPIVSVSGKGGPNPVQTLSPDVSYLDSGFLKGATIQGDFLEKETVIPLKDMFPLVYCFYTLEHVRNPFKWCRHLLYITEPGGYVYLSTVFWCAYHPSPEDYFRFSPSGLELLFENLPCEILWAGWEDKECKGVAILVRKRQEVKE